MSSASNRWITVGFCRLICTSAEIVFGGTVTYGNVGCFIFSGDAALVGIPGEVGRAVLLEDDACGEVGLSGGALVGFMWVLYRR